MARARSHTVRPNVARCWTAFVDIYGFSALLRHKNSDDIYKALDAYQASVISIAEERGLSYFLFGDSFIFAIPSKDDHYQSFRSANETLQKVYYEAIKLGFMLRGALTYGDVHIARHYILGGPVLRAVEVEKELALPIICAPSSDLQSANILQETGISVEFLPTKKGIIQAMDLVRMPYDVITKTISSYLADTAMHGPQEVAAVWLALQNHIDNQKSKLGEPVGTRRISKPPR